MKHRLVKYLIRDLKKWEAEPCLQIIDPSIDPTDESSDLRTSLDDDEKPPEDPFTRHSYEIPDLSRCTADEAEEALLEIIVFNRLLAKPDLRLLKVRTLLQHRRVKPLDMREMLDRVFMSIDQNMCF